MSGYIERVSGILKFRFMYECEFCLNRDLGLWESVNISGDPDSVRRTFDDAEARPSHMPVGWSSWSHAGVIQYRCPECREKRIEFEFKEGLGEGPR